jgi:hypothetical protein
MAACCYEEVRLETGPTRISSTSTSGSSTGKLRRSPVGNRTYTHLIHLDLRQLDGQVTKKSGWKPDLHCWRLLSLAEMYKLGGALGHRALPASSVDFVNFYRLTPTAGYSV